MNWLCWDSQKFVSVIDDRKTDWLTGFEGLNESGGACKLNDEGDNNVAKITGYEKRNVMQHD